MLELIIAIFIILMALSGALTLIAKSIQMASLVKNQVIASNLAAEGIEVIRNIRDTNWLEDPPEPYDDFDGDESTDIIANCNPGPPNIAYVDYNSTSTSTGLAPTMSWIGGYYRHSSTPNTSFSRHIELCRALDDDNVPLIEIKSVVTWEYHGPTKQIELIDYLYDWKPE